MEVNFFPLGVILLIITQTGYGYTNNDFCMEESSCQDVCESRAGYFENEMETKFRHSKYRPMPKQQGALSRYHSATENSRIYKERNPSKEHHSYNVYENQQRSKDRQHTRSSNNRRINELHNRSFEETKTRDLSRRRVDISSHRNAHERGESASRPRYMEDVLTVSKRMDRDLPFNGFRKERESRYNFRLDESRNAAYREKRESSDRHSTVQQRDVRSSRQDHMNDARSVTTRDEIRSSDYRRSDKNRSSNDVARVQTRATNVRRLENFNHSFQTRDQTSTHSRRIKTQDRHRESKHVGTRSGTPVANNRRVETREQKLEHRDRIPPDEIRHVETRNRYVENSDGKGIGYRRSIVSPYHRVMSNADDLTPNVDRNNLLENDDSRIERSNRRTLVDQQHAKSRNHVVTHGIEFHERKLERLELISVYNTRRIETHLNRLGNQSRLPGDSSRRVVTRDRNLDYRNWVSADDSGLMTTRERRVENDDRMLTSNDIRRQENRNSRVKIYNRMLKNENYDRIVTRNISVNAMNREPSIERHNQMPERRDHSVKSYNRMPENKAFDVERRSRYINNSNRRIGISSNRPESGKSILTHDGRLDHERRSFDIVRNVANHDNVLNSIERRSDRRYRMSFDNGHHLITRRSVNAINTASVRENLESHLHKYNDALKALVLQTGNRQGSMLKDTNLPEKYHVSDSYIKQSGRENKANHERTRTWTNREQAALFDTKPNDDAPACSILFNTFKTLFIGLLIIQLVDFKRNEKLRETERYRSFLGRFTLSHLLTKKVY